MLVEPLGPRPSGIYISQFLCQLSPWILNPVGYISPYLYIVRAPEPLAPWSIHLPISVWGFHLSISVLVEPLSTYLSQIYISQFLCQSSSQVLTLLVYSSPCLYVDCALNP